MRRLAGYVGLYFMACGWLPPLWYLTHLKARYGGADLYWHFASGWERAALMLLFLLAFAATMGYCLVTAKSRLKL